MYILVIRESVGINLSSDFTHLLLTEAASLSRVIIIDYLIHSAL